MGGLRIGDIGPSVVQPLLVLGRNVLPFTRLARNDAADLAYAQLGRCLIPAGALQLGSMLWIHSVWTYTNSASVKVIQPIVNQDPDSIAVVNSLGQLTPSTTLISIMAQSAYVTAVGAAGNLKCQNGSTTISGASSSATSPINRTINTDVDNYIHFMSTWQTGTDRTGEQVQLDHWAVMLFP